MTEYQSEIENSIQNSKYKQRRNEEEKKTSIIYCIEKEESK
jgi:hypothetical protein